MAAGAFLVATHVQAGMVSVWPNAVVLDDHVRLHDVAELRDLMDSETSSLGDLIITQAPPPGGSKVVPIDLIRKALGDAGFNLAHTVLRGAVACSVTRPRRAPSDTDSEFERAAESSRSHATKKAAPTEGTARSSVRSALRASALPTESPLKEARHAMTLRQAVVDYFDEALAGFGGRAEVTFDHTSEQVLSAAGPTYSFQVRSRERNSLGMVQIEVDVLSDGQRVQTVPLVVHVRMVRPTVVARRAINQGATVEEDDVHLVRMTYDRADRPGISSLSQVIGQRARRMIPAGSALQSEMLEPVPLVLRGQIVTVEAVVGRVEVVTTGTALAEGLLGETVRIRAPSRKNVQYEAQVVGRGRVRVGHTETPAAAGSLASVGPEGGLPE